jgi:hypothetical protein
MKYRYIIIGPIIFMFLLVAGVSYNNFVTTSYASFTSQPKPWHHDKVFELMIRKANSIDYFMVEIIHTNDTWVKVKNINSGIIYHIPIYSIISLKEL